MSDMVGHASAAVHLSETADQCLDAVSDMVCHPSDTVTETVPMLGAGNYVVAGLGPYGAGERPCQLGHQFVVLCGIRRRQVHHHRCVVCHLCRRHGITHRLCHKGECHRLGLTTLMPCHDIDWCWSGNLPVQHWYVSPVNMDHGHTLADDDVEDGRRSYIASQHTRCCSGTSAAGETT